MFGATKRRRLVDLPELQELGPVRVDINHYEANVALIAAEHADFGGEVQARLEPAPGEDALTVVLRYASHKLPVGHLTAATLGGQLYDQILKHYRHGELVACTADILSGSSYEVWLNRPSTQGARRAPSLRPA